MCTNFDLEFEDDLINKSCRRDLGLGFVSRLPHSCPVSIKLDIFSSILGKHCSLTSAHFASGKHPFKVRETSFWSYVSSHHGNLKETKVHVIIFKKDDE